MIWNLDQAQAIFHSHAWQGSLDLTNPENGISLVAPNGKKITGLLGVSFPKPSLPLSQDCYVRQSDLIVSYPPRELRKFHVQLDYRILDASSEALLVELWISVQTYLLDNHPVVTVLAPFDSKKLEIYRVNTLGSLEVDDATALAIDRSTSELNTPKIAIASGTSSDHELSIALLNHPKDQSDTVWNPANYPSYLEAKLFGHFMEKGVIRRARMRCFISSKPFRGGQLQEIYDAFVESPLPLTA